MSTSEPGSSVSSTTIPLIGRTIVVGRGSRGLRCPGCTSPLNLLQPDENNPVRLLGICDTCGKWTVLVELEADVAQGLALRTPGGGSTAPGPRMREASRGVALPSVTRTAPQRGLDRYRFFRPFFSFAFGFGLIRPRPLRVSPEDFRGRPEVVSDSSERRASAG